VGTVRNDNLLIVEAEEVQSIHREVSVCSVFGNTEKRKELTCFFGIGVVNEDLLGFQCTPMRLTSVQGGGPGDMACGCCSQLCLCSSD